MSKRCMLYRSLSFRNSFGGRTQFYCDTSCSSNVRFWPTLRPRLSATRLIEPIPLLRNVDEVTVLQEKNRNGGQHEVDQIPRDLGWRARPRGGSKFSVRPVLLWLRLLPGLRLRV